MPRHDSQRSQAHRRWRQRGPELQGGPVAFPWEEDLLPLAPLQGSLYMHEGNESESADISLHNIVFNIAGSAQLWSKRKEYVKLWWRPDEMLGFLWLDEKVEVFEGDAAILPQVLVSEDISRFKYTYSTGQPSGVRIARVIQEVFKLGLPNVCWFVLGDDDTIFSPYNLVRVLKKYDHNEMYYIGYPSESHASNTHFSHGMAFGGGGIAISYPLAEALSRMLDECLERYTFLIGSDDRLHACITELGVPLTKEAGFHQFDVHGNVFGLLAAHPISPFVSMHHLEEVDPMFPKLDALTSLRHLMYSMHIEPSSFLQHCICYDREQKLSLSISLGYVVQVFPYVILPRELERPEITFKAWNSKQSRGEFDLDTRKSLRPVCHRPVSFYIEDIYLDEDGRVVSTYKRDSSVDEKKQQSLCLPIVFHPKEAIRIRILSKPMSDQWFLVRAQPLVETLHVRPSECLAQHVLISRWNRLCVGLYQ
ncbi:hypothetical protein GOP47_0029143 [Adiantum capillus-veneris]|nr:hypothetical protein GOP47_0029143 [Adiantum capillus-veneris]